MKSDDRKTENENPEKKALVEKYYRKVMRFLEYYVLLCFILVTFVPLLNFNWVPVFIKLIYFTGFPLLILIFMISIFKESLQTLILKLLER
jgi:hypothetical protein